jgi:hypothetical protein
LMALAMSFGSFNFSSFTSKEGNFSTVCTFAVSFFIMFRVILIVLLDML